MNAKIALFTLLTAMSFPIFADLYTATRWEPTMQPYQSCVREANDVLKYTGFSGKSGYDNEPDSHGNGSSWGRSESSVSVIKCVPLARSIFISVSGKDRDEVKKYANDIASQLKDKNKPYLIRRIDVVDGNNDVGGHPYSAKFSPDGTYFAVGSMEQSESHKIFDSSDTHVRIWNINTGALLHSLKHQSFVKSFAFDTSGKYIVSGDLSGIVYLWDVTTGRLLK